jgi:hypothetical protein
VEPPKDIYIMNRSVLVLLVLFYLLATTAEAQKQYAPPSQCPVLATLASSKVPSLDSSGDHIVIWFWNQGSKTTHGVEFQLLMLDAAGNKYPASQKYIATGDEKPNSGDLVMYPTTEEEQHFAADWKNIDGVEVYVTSIMYSDATTWKPKRGSVCKTAFINADYDKEMERRGKVAEQKMKASEEKWNREHPNNQIPVLPDAEAPKKP